MPKLPTTYLPEFDTLEERITPVGGGALRGTTVSLGDENGDGLLDIRVHVKKLNDRLYLYLKRGIHEQASRLLARGNVFSPHLSQEGALLHKASPNVLRLGGGATIILLTDPTETGGHAYTINFHVHSAGRHGLGNAGITVGVPGGAVPSAPVTQQPPTLPPSVPVDPRDKIFAEMNIDESLPGHHSYDLHDVRKGYRENPNGTVEPMSHAENLSEGGELRAFRFEIQGMLDAQSRPTNDLNQAQRLIVGVYGYYDKNGDGIADVNNLGMNTLDAERLTQRLEPELIIFAREGNGTGGWTQDTGVSIEFRGPNQPQNLTNASTMNIIQQFAVVSYRRTN
jgi:hypothetical protein